MRRPSARRVPSHDVGRRTTANSHDDLGELDAAVSEQSAAPLDDRDGGLFASAVPPHAVKHAAHSDAGLGVKLGEVLDDGFEVLFVRSELHAEHYFMRRSIPPARGGCGILRYFWRFGVEEEEEPF